MSPQKPNADQIIQESHDVKAHAKHHHQRTGNADYVYAGRYSTNPIPAYHLAAKGVSADATYRLIHDELSLDGSTVLNLASFVHTWMPPQADQLVKENITKNLIDVDEYPATQLIHARCISILADLWHAPSPHDAVGTATTGSSEAIELGGLAMKKNWQERMKKMGKNIHEPGPNIVMGANAQVALEKFARYFDVECRLVPVTKKSRYCLDPKEAMKYVDENTIGVFVILGSTYTGHYESVKEMSDQLDEYERRTGIHVPIHVDGASGAFVAPFASPDLLWDFRIPRVVSINASGHKYGLSYVGVGWVIFRSPEHLPKSMVFELNYLGSVQYSFSLNFSRPAAPIIAQYFSLVHLGREGYKGVVEDDLRNARLLSRALENMGVDGNVGGKAIGSRGNGKAEAKSGEGWWEVISDVHRAAGIHKGPGIVSDDIQAYEPGLPVVAFKFSEKFKKENPDIQQRWVHVLLRAKGWIIPNYDLPPTLEKEQILRVVVRENTSEVLIDRLIGDIIEIMEQIIQEAPHEKTIKMVDSAQNQGARHGRKVREDSQPLKAGDGSKASGTYNHLC